MSDLKETERTVKISELFYAFVWLVIISIIGFILIPVIGIFAILFFLWGLAPFAFVLWNKGKVPD